MGRTSNHCGLWGNVTTAGTRTLPADSLHACCAGSMRIRSPGLSRRAEARRLETGYDAPANGTHPPFTHSHARRRELDVGVLPGLGEATVHLPGLGLALLRAQALRQAIQRPAVVGIALQFRAIGGFRL